MPRTISDQCFFHCKLSRSSHLLIAFSPDFVRSMVDYLFRLLRLLLPKDVINNDLKIFEPIDADVKQHTQMTKNRLLLAKLLYFVIRRAFQGNRENELYASKWLTEIIGDFKYDVGATFVRPWCDVGATFVRPWYNK